MCSICGAGKPRNHIPSACHGTIPFLVTFERCAQSAPGKLVISYDSRTSSAHNYTDSEVKGIDRRGAHGSATVN